MKTLAFGLAMSLAACMVFVAAENNAAAQRRAIGGAGGLSRWGPVRPIQPITPIRPINPIRPIQPIYPWNPWWGGNIIVPQYSYLYPNYFYPPSRWDAGGWDGQVRNVQPQPQPQPRTPREPERPLVMQWNAAKGKAEVVDLGRWDNQAPSQPATTTPPATDPPLSSEGTEKLNRWDDSLP